MSKIYHDIEFERDHDLFLYKQFESMMKNDNTNGMLNVTKQIFRDITKKCIYHYVRLKKMKDTNYMMYLFIDVSEPAEIHNMVLDIKKFKNDIGYLSNHFEIIEYGNGSNIDRKRIKELIEDINHLNQIGNSNIESIHFTKDRAFFTEQLYDKSPKIRIS